MIYLGWNFETLSSFANLAASSADIQKWHNDQPIRSKSFDLSLFHQNVEPTDPPNLSQNHTI
jgi:hypothetical protein